MGCSHYSPMGAHILIIKLAAIGDVLRTTSLLPSLAQAYETRHVTWVTDESALPLLAGNPRIDRLLPFGFETVHRLLAEEFDLLICLDKEHRATALAM